MAPQSFKKHTYILQKVLGQFDIIINFGSCLDIFTKQASIEILMIQDLKESWFRPEFKKPMKSISTKLFYESDEFKLKIVYQND